MNEPKGRRELIKLLGFGGVVFASGLAGACTRILRKSGGGEDDFFFVQLSDTHWGFRVRRALEAPVRGGELDEKEIVLPSARLAQDPGACSGQPRGEDHASEAEKLDELATPFGFVHGKPSGAVTARV